MRSLRHSLSIDKPIDRVFDFFSRAENLEKVTPPSLRFRILTPPPIEMEPGTSIDYRIRLLGIPMTDFVEYLTPGCVSRASDPQVVRRQTAQPDIQLSRGQIFRNFLTHLVPPGGPRFSNSLLLSSAMGKPKCIECRSELSKLIVRSDGVEEELKDYGYCGHCKRPAEISTFYQKFGFESFERQEGKDSLEVGGHTLVWRSIAGQDQYYCLTCDADLLHSHHHHG